MTIPAPASLDTKSQLRKTMGFWDVLLFNIATVLGPRWNPLAILVPGGTPGVWIAGGLGFVVVLIGILVSLVPPGDSADKFGFELKLVAGTAASVLLGLILYWRGARAKQSEL
jgi:hypothetical protein